MKKWYSSKLIWSGFVTSGYGVAKLLGVDAELTPGALETALGIIVMILRFITKEEVVLK